MKKFSLNVAWNAGGTAVYVLALQVIVYPVLAVILDADDFGGFLAVVAVSSAVGNVVGSANTNLILRGLSDDPEWIDRGRHAVFSQLFLGSLLVGGSTALGLLLTISSAEVATPLALFVLLASRLYLTVNARIQRRFLEVFRLQCVVAFGYLMGLLLFYIAILNSPVLILCLGELLGIAYISRRNPFVAWPDPGCAVDRAAIRKLSGLFVGSGANNLGSYGDRPILKAMTDAENVPVFFAAALPGRMLQAGGNVFASVLLSHISAWPRNRLQRSLMGGIAICSVAGFIAWAVLGLLSGQVLAILYPAFHDQALQYVYVVNAAFSARFTEQLLRPIFLRMMPIRIFATIDVISAALYLSMGVVIAAVYGLSGFVWLFAGIALVKLAAQIGGLLLVVGGLRVSERTC